MTKTYTFKTVGHCVNSAISVLKYVQSNQFKGTMAQMNGYDKYELEMSEEDAVLLKLSVPVRDLKLKNPDENLIPSYRFKKST